MPPPQTNRAPPPKKPATTPTPNSEVLEKLSKDQKATHRTANPYEKQFGYHRAVRKGPFIFVSGTTSLIEGTREVRLKNNARAQAIAVMQDCIKAVQSLGGKEDDICRVRMFVAGHEHTGEVGRALKAVFGDLEVAATAVVVNGFVDPEMLVEVEVDAIVG
ncbi:MAG: hypothetical protein Q9227_008604 [Pyrenula ochraceoflavens]